MIDCGVDLERFSVRSAGDARAEIGWSPSGTAFLCVGLRSQLGNALALALALKRRGEGSLAFVGDGPLRRALEGRPGIHVEGQVSHETIPSWFAAADVVCQPSLAEPFGLATLEGLASGSSAISMQVLGVTPELDSWRCWCPCRPGE